MKQVPLRETVALGHAAKEVLAILWRDIQTARRAYLEACAA